MRSLFVLLLLACLSGASAQSYLDRQVTLHVRRQPLARVLDTLARRAGCGFSYNSSILPQDSLVTASYNRAPLRQVLEGLLGTGYQYVPSGRYLIILRQPPPPKETSWLLTGHVLDASTGKPLYQASVYLPDQLQTTLTDEQGFFRLRLRERNRAPTLTVSKEWYQDTTLSVAGEHAGEQEYTIAISPARVTEIAPLTISTGIEHNWWGRLFLSSRERVQSMNLTRFFTSEPYQVSLLPSLGTHGRMAPQVTNTVSLNLIGGYSAGTRGVELAGVFNLDKRSVGMVQAAGLLNVAGGPVVGAQLAGAVNSDLDSVSGCIVAGFANVVHGPVAGLEVAGFANLSRDPVRGVQVAGAYNRAPRIDGMQIGIINHARRLNGFQLGLVNIADTSDGYSLGLVSIVRHGIHQLSVSYGETTGFTAAYKGGNPALYSILLGGYDPRGGYFSMGYGVGHAFHFHTSPWGLLLELTGETINDQRWRSVGAIYRLTPAVTFRLSSAVSLFAGVRASLFAADRHPPAGEHVPPSFAAGWDPRTSGWIGATAGLIFF